MERQTFEKYNCDLTQIQKNIATYFVGRCYRVTNFFKDKLYVTQAYKSQTGNKAIICQITGIPEKFEISIGFGLKITNVNSLQPLEKIPLDVKVLLGEPLLERNFLNYIFTQTELKRNTFGLGKTDAASFQTLAPIFREREVVREIEVMYCRYCGTKNNARQTNCSKCNATLR